MSTFKALATMAEDQERRAAGALLRNCPTAYDFHRAMAQLIAGMMFTTPAREPVD